MEQSDSNVVSWRPSRLLGAVMVATCCTGVLGFVFAAIHTTSGRWLFLLLAIISIAVGAAFLPWLVNTYRAEVGSSTILIASAPIPDLLVGKQVPFGRGAVVESRFTPRGGGLQHLVLVDDDREFVLAFCSSNRQAETVTRRIQDAMRRNIGG